MDAQQLRNYQNLCLVTPLLLSHYQGSSEPRDHCWTNGIAAPLWAPLHYTGLHTWEIASSSLSPLLSFFLWPNTGRGWIIAIIESESSSACLAAWALIIAYQSVKRCKSMSLPGWWSPGSHLTSVIITIRMSLLTMVTSLTFCIIKQVTHLYLSLSPVKEIFLDRKEMHFWRLSKYQK